MYFGIIEENGKPVTKRKANNEHVFYQYILSSDNFSFRLLLTKICSPEANNWAIKCNAQRSQVLIPTAEYQVSDIKHSIVCITEMKCFPIFFI